MPKRKKHYLDIDEINKTLDELVNNTNVQMDDFILSDNLNMDKIKRISAERITIKRIRNIFNQAVIENQEEI